MRKLVTIRRISSIDPIPNADMIECVTVDGWKVVAKKGEFNVGDLAVYFEIDSLLPIRPEFEFLRKSSYIKNEKYEGFRLRTVKLRGQISQGLVVPLMTFKNDPWFNQTIVEDLTEKLGVVKWEPNFPVSLSGNVAGKFPQFIPKTDQERIQNLSDKLQEWSNKTINHWEVTEKLEGQSVTIFINFSDKENYDFGVCTRNWQIKEDEDNAIWKLVRSLDLETKMQNLGLNMITRGNNFGMALQGEFIGPGVQGNHYKLKEHEFRIFDVFNIKGGYYLPCDLRLKVVNMLGLNHVPIINTDFEVFDNMNEMLSFADGKSKLNTDVLREGLVYKNLVDPSVSFKTVSNEYLLKEK